MARLAFVAFAALLLTACGHSPPEPPAGMGRLIIKCCELMGGTPEAPDCRPNRALDKATVLVDGAERGTCKNWRGDGAILATGRHAIQVRVPLDGPLERASAASTPAATSRYTPARSSRSRSA